MNLLKTTIKKIQPVDMTLEPKLRTRLDNLTKPTGSLGYMEDIVIRYGLMINSLDFKPGKKRIYTFAADHGVVESGVTCYPKEVTRQMVLNMLSGGAAINVLARHAGAEVAVVDMGVDADFDDSPGLVRRKIRKGTNNIEKGPAMTADETIQAIHVGIDLANIAKDDGVKMLGTGEMGIANTTPSSALFAVMLPCSVQEITGRGAGINDAMLTKKIGVIERAIKVNKVRLTDPLSTLAALGGFEIAGICGLCLGAAANRIPVVVDGFISTAGALAACRMCGIVKQYLFFSHLSHEQGHCVFMENFGVRPILDLDLRLGEGTGAAIAMTIIDASLKIYNEMATFGSAGVTGDKTA
jgi:nicotinate-nucleotide--dimethylbenzimidazole phosphoribosyltransferase